MKQVILTGDRPTGRRTSGTMVGSLKNGFGCRIPESTTRSIL